MISNFNQYQNTQFSTSSPEKLLVMLYDGAINFSRIALDKMNRGDMAGKGVYISKAQAIVSEFMNTLNHDIGGDVSRKLEQLYIYINDEFVNANIKNSPRAIENALKILVILRDTWVEAIEIHRKEKATAFSQQSSTVQYAGRGL